MKKVLKILGVIVIVILIAGVVSCARSLGDDKTPTKSTQQQKAPTAEDYKTMRSALDSLMVGKDRVSKIVKGDSELYTRLTEYDNTLVKKKDAINFISDEKSKETYRDRMESSHEALQALCKMLKEPSTYTDIKAKEAVTTIHDNSNWAETEYNKIKDK